jgi:hypothetical protein
MVATPITVIGGKEQGHLISVNGQFHRLEIRHKNNPKVFIATIPFIEIASLEPLASQTINPTDTAVFGTLGFMVGGPLGAAAGAGLSRLSRECDFVLKTTSGDTYVCRGWRKFYDLIVTNRQIALAYPEQSTALARQNLPESKALQTARSQLNQQPAPIPKIWLWSVIIFLVIIGLGEIGKM